MKWIRKILTLLVVAAVVGAAVYYSLAPRPVLVDTVSPKRGRMQVSIVEEGRTRVADRFVVSAPVAGIAGRVRLRVGDRVNRGQTVVRIEPPRSAALDPRGRAELTSRVSVAEAALERSRRDVEAAREDLRYWQAEAPRLRAGVEAGVAARERLDSAESEARRADARLKASEQQVEVARAELNAARVALEFATARAPEAPGEAVDVRSPVAGRVLKLHHESEAAVREGDPLIEVADPAGLEVEVEALSSDAVRIEPGMRVLLERWGGPEARGPRTAHRAGGLHQGVRAGRRGARTDDRRYRLGQDKWRRLGDRYRVEARFILWEGDGVLQAPTSAVFRNGDGWAVFVLEGERARLRPIQIGRRAGLTVEVLAGVGEGDRLVNHPGDAISDGTLVSLVE